MYFIELNGNSLNFIDKYVKRIARFTFLLYFLIPQNEFNFYHITFYLIIFFKSIDRVEF